jgi:hypothetical protein
VLVEIISYYNRVGQASWVRAERVFDKFYELLKDARDPVKETVLITVGRVGRSAIFSYVVNGLLIIFQSNNDRFPESCYKLPDISACRS